ncbi:phage tail protein [Elizabethkingia anophelis]|nr:phage tail protein [Elizabethkingia anophelis]MCT4170311.1 phage tail protein [Elizabethkingia anophelis]MCT4244789.1 phage tail protein [Elizabethkingia anophelis]MCT4248461.1 phage tail protein [Elizabethkingia anophelis]MCT4259451.1 phage tail protein [Elizabethkingia anophelis]
MGEIVINKKNTTIDLFNYKPFRSVTKAELSRTLMSDDYVDISVECANPLDLSLGDRVMVEGRTFFLNMLPPAKKLAEDQFSYELRFEGPAFLLRKLKVFNLDSQGNKTTNEFPLTGEINEFLYLLINNANKKENQWILGSFPSNTETKTLTFNNENCLAVLQRICQEFNVEFDIVEAGGKFTLNIREKIGKTLPFTVEYGMGNGLYDLSRARANDSEVVTVLYAYGSSQNIPVDYRGYSPRLRMPVAVGDYISNQAAIDLFGYVEDVFTPDIKPTFKGKVSGIGSLTNGVQEVSVSNMDFDLKEKKADGSTKYWIAGTPPKISVTKGDLAGYDFEVLDYIHATKTFKIKQFADDRGQKFPDNTTVFKFSIGDEFTLIDIMMPEQYIINAEQKLYDETVKEYQKVSQNNVKYTLNVDPLFLQDKGEIGIGDLLPIKDADFGIDKASRIISLKKDLLTDTYTSFDVADSYEISLVKEIVNNIKDLQKEIASQKIINRQSYLDGYRRVEDRFSMYFDADGKMDGSHIKADTIDVGMLSSGSKSRWFQLEEVVFTTNLGSDQNSFRVTAGRLVHFGIKTSSGAERVWNLAALTVSNLLNQGYYVYAKCDINGDYGTFIVTPDRIIFDSQPNYYHFLIGNLYSPSNGFRIFDANYGVSQVNGRQITAGEIASVNRRLIIDLDKGEIIGKVTFTNDSPALNQVQEKIDAVQVGGRNLILNSASIIMSGNDYQNSDNSVLGEITIIKSGKWNCYNWLTLPSGYDKIGKQLTMSLELLVDNQINFGVGVHFAYEQNLIRKDVSYIAPGKWTKVFITYDKITGTNTSLIGLDGIDAPVGTKIKYRHFKLEEGNKATDWTLAPEDVESSILKSKTDSITASKAYSDAQDALKETTIKAYADGKITEAENRSIIDATNKADAAKTYATAQDNLLKIQLEAYADGKIDIEESARIQQAQNNLAAAKAYSDAQDNLAKIAAQAYADGVVDAEEARAIADATAKMEAAKTHAQGLVNNIVIGGRNLILNSASIIMSGNDYQNSDNSVAGVIKVNNTNNPWNCYNFINQSKGFKVGDIIAYSIDLMPSFNCEVLFNYMPHFDNNLFSKEVYINTNVWTRVSLIGEIISSVGDAFLIGLSSKNTPNLVLKYRNPQVEQATKASDYSPAPEDVENKIKQNEQQTALAKAQADNALATSNITSQKVSFLSTTINNNVVSTGTLEVGDVVGANAGITGVTDRGRQSVRMYAGAPYANKNTAPFTLQDDGLIKMHHPNGNKGFELGIVDGKLVFNVYDDIGNKIMEMGSQGIIFSNYIPDSWTNLKLAKFDSANYSPYDATSVTNFANSNTRQIMVNNPGGIEDAQHWNVFVPKTEASHINYSTYSAGRSYDSNTYVIYEGIYFEGTLQKPQKPNSSTAKLADGWYYNIVFMSVWKKYGDPYQTGAYSYTFQLFRLSAGKVVETKDYTINGQV